MDMSGIAILVTTIVVMAELHKTVGEVQKESKKKEKHLLTNSLFTKYRRVACTSTQFSCPDKCILQAYVCDTIRDCDNGYDEQNCPTDCSGANQFKCANGRCIPKVYQCDRDNDCGDGSDESACGFTCSSSRFQCSNGACVNTLWICDGEDDCGDNSDEQNCQDKTCGASQFTCANNICIPGYYQCDGDNDCGDHSDEIGCTCDSNHIQCNNGGCIYLSFKCDGENDCGDMTDEANCPEIHPGACADMLTFEDCARMNTTTYPVCDYYADAHRFCRKFCSLCNM